MESSNTLNSSIKGVVTLNNVNSLKKIQRPFRRIEVIKMVKSANIRLSVHISCSQFTVLIVSKRVASMTNETRSHLLTYCLCNECVGDVGPCCLK